MYCNADDLISIIPEKELINLTNDTSQATAVDADVVAACVQVGDDLINAALRNKYTLPLKFVPSIIRSLSMDIAAYRLYTRRPRTIPEHIKKNYEVALDMLKQLQKGVLVLDLPQESQDGQGTVIDGAILVNKTKYDRKFGEEVWRKF